MSDRVRPSKVFGVESVHRRLLGGARISGPGEIDCPAEMPELRTSSVIEGETVRRRG